MLHSSTYLLLLFRTTLAVSSSSTYYVTKLQSCYLVRSANRSKFLSKHTCPPSLHSQKSMIRAIIRPLLVPLPSLKPRDIAYFSSTFLSPEFIWRRFVWPLLVSTKTALTRGERGERKNEYAENERYSRGIKVVDHADHCLFDTKRLARSRCFKSDSCYDNSMIR